MPANRQACGFLAMQSGPRCGFPALMIIERRVNVRFWPLANMAIVPQNVRLWPKADIPSGINAIPCRRHRTRVINLRATILELLQQVESWILLWVDGGRVSQRKGPNHEQDI